MKKTLINFIMSFLLVFIPSMLLVLLITFLNYQQIINFNLSKIIIYTLSSISFFLFSLILSIKEKSHGLIRGLILSTIYLLLFFIITKDKSFYNILFLILRMFSLILGSVLGVNFIKTN